MKQIELNISKIQEISFQEFMWELKIRDLVFGVKTKLCSHYIGLEEENYICLPAIS